MKKILFYCGLNKGRSFAMLKNSFDICYGFEADPECYTFCKKKFARDSHVKLFQGALTTFDGEIEFNIFNQSPANSVGSSINSSYNFQHQPVRKLKTIKVPAINLYTFCKEKEISHITTYISDLQGLDFEVLYTLKPLIDKGKINKIVCEVEMEDKRIYPDLSSNFKEKFDELLSDNYTLEKVQFPGNRKGPHAWKWWADCTWIKKEASI